IYSSRIVLRVLEGDVDIATAPRPKGKLREYVADVAFSSARLGELIRKRDLYPRERARDPSFAMPIEAMRDDIEVEVWRNYFLEQRSVDDPARSARIAI